MATTPGKMSGSGFVSNLVVLLLLAVAVGLYLRIVVIEGDRQYREAVPQASIQIVEAHEAPAGEPNRILVPLPDDQMMLIKQVFAPELLR